MNIGYLKAILFIIKIIKALLPTFFDTKEALKKNCVSKFIILGSRKVSHNLNKLNVPSESENCCKVYS